MSRDVQMSDRCDPIPDSEQTTVWENLEELIQKY